MRTPALVLCAALAAALVPGCQRRPGPTEAPEEAPEAGPEDEASESESSDQTGTTRRAQASRRPPSGATCTGRGDCTSDQICVQGACVYRASSVSGEILASAAAAQEATGDWEAAIETYNAAFARFREDHAPVPPAIGCRAAVLTLRNARDADAREQGARQADLCFRSTVAGHPARTPVMRALSRLRYEGLDMAAFDRSEPAAQFFTEEASRPTVDVVRTEVQMPDLESESRSHTAIRELLLGEDGVRTIADCFVQDWETRHEAEAEAELVLRYTTRLRDMGSYDVYAPEIAVEGTTGTEEGFEACLVRGLPDLFDPNNRSIRSEPWNQAVRFTATIR